MLGHWCIKKQQPVPRYASQSLNLYHHRLHHYRWASSLGPIHSSPTTIFNFRRKKDGQVLFQNPHLQREFHNYILQTEGHSAASSFMNTIQQYNRSNAHNTVPGPTRSGSHHTNAQLVRATHSENDLGHMQRSENESPSKNSRPKRETVSVHLEEPPRAGSRDSVASHGAPDFSDHSDHSRRSSFSDWSRETSSPACTYSEWKWFSPSACSLVWVQYTRYQIHRYLARNRIPKCTLKQMVIRDHGRTGIMCRTTQIPQIIHNNEVEKQKVMIYSMTWSCRLS